MQVGNLDWKNDMGEREVEQKKKNNMTQLEGRRSGMSRNNVLHLDGLSVLYSCTCAGRFPTVCVSPDNSATRIQPG